MTGMEYREQKSIRSCMTNLHGVKRGLIADEDAGLRDVLWEHPIPVARIKKAIRKPSGKSIIVRDLFSSRQSSWKDHRCWRQWQRHKPCKRRIISEQKGLSLDLSEMCGSLFSDLDDLFF